MNNYPSEYEKMLEAEREALRRELAKTQHDLKETKKLTDMLISKSPVRYLHMIAEY
jgi:hypothetical protein